VAAGAEFRRFIIVARPLISRIAPITTAFSFTVRWNHRMIH
jgi:hypothetical protein